MSVAAVPSITLNQAFLQKCVYCAFNRLDEKVTLHCTVPGLSRGPAPCISQAGVEASEKLVPTLFSTVNGVFVQGSSFKFPFFLPPSFYLDTTTLKSGFFLSAFLFVCLRKIRLCSCSGRILVLSKMKGRNYWPGKSKVAGV